MNEIESPYLLKIVEISLDNKYTKWYIALCKRALSRTPSGKTDKHHILPACFQLGGITDPSNLVHLSLREHFVCHLLLTKMVTDHRRYQMLVAACLMANRVKSSRAYEYLRVRRDKEHGPRHSLCMKAVHQNRPDIQEHRKATLASKPTLICSNCQRQFKYPLHLQKHGCNLKDEGSSQRNKLTQQNHPELRVKLAEARAKARAARAPRECAHCKQVFKYMGRWRKHAGCVSN